LLRYSKMKTGSIQQAVSVMILLPLDGDVSNPFVLNDYYQTKLDDFTSGTLRFPLRNLALDCINNIQSMGRLQQSNYRRDSICCRR
jgi:hypothetical protein